MVNVVVIEVLLATVVLLTLIPVPLSATIALFEKFVPVRVTVTVCPCPPEVELAEVSVGLGVKAGVAPHPAINKTTSRSAIPRFRDHILPGPYFDIGDCVILTDTFILHFFVGSA